MTTFQMPQTIDSVRDEPLDPMQLSYFQEQFRSQVYYAIVETFRREVEEGNLSQAVLARRLDKDPAIVSKWFSGPRNFQLDTIGEMLLAMGAEPELQIHLFRTPAPAPNYSHPLIDDLAGNYPVLQDTGIAKSDFSPKSVTDTGSLQTNTANFG